MLVFLQPASNIFRLENIEAGTLDQAGVSIGTQYYCTIERTSVTAIELRIYSDSGRTTLIDTLTQSIPSEVSYRYIYSAMSTNSGHSGRIITFDSENLDLQEAGPSFVPYPFSRGLRAGQHALSGGLA